MIKKKDLKVSVEAKQKSEHVIRSFRIEAQTLKKAEKKAQQLGYSLNAFVQALLDASVK